MRTRIAIVLSLSVAAASGCASMMKGPDAALSLSKDQLGAVDRVTEARCERQAACRSSAAGTSTPVASCEANLRQKTAVDLELSQCGGHIDDSALDRCVHQLRARDCNAEFDNVDALAPDCRLGIICPLGAEPGTA